MTARHDKATEVCAGCGHERSLHERTHGYKPYGECNFQHDLCGCRAFRTGGRTEAAAVDQAIAKVRAYLPKPGHRNDHVLESLRVLADAVEELRGDRRVACEWAAELAGAKRAAEAERDNIKRDYDDVFGQLTRRHGDVHRLARQVADLGDALRFYSDERNWTQITSWGGRIFDDESVAIRDMGSIARTALAARSRDPQEPQT